LKQLSFGSDCIYVDRYPTNPDIKSSELSSLFSHANMPTELTDFIVEFWGITILKKIRGRMYQRFVVKHLFTEEQLKHTQIVIGCLESFGNHVDVEYDLASASFYIKI